MRRPLPEPHPFRRRRVASPQVKTQFVLQSHSNDGRAQILPDVVSKRTQRRDVDSLHRRRQRVFVEFPQEKIENSQKSRQRLAAPGWRSEQNRLPIENGGHAQQLRMSKPGIGVSEPFRERRGCKRHSSACDVVAR